MAMGSGLLVLAMMAADGPSGSPDETTTFQVRVLTLDGLDWRTSSYSRLTPVTRQGTSAIWTADRTLALGLADRASSVVNGGKIVALGEAVISQSKSVSYVAAMDRVADGPINQSTAIAFMPRPERVDERFAIKLAGRQLDQGVLTRVTLEETHVDALHSVVQTESLKADPVKPTRTASEVGRDVVKSIMAQNGGETPSSITGSIQIPEVSQTRIDGEWLIPKDGVLLISLGVKTVADDSGKAVVRERLAIIEVNPAAEPGQNDWLNGGPAATVKTTSLASPATPQRSLPQPVDPSGGFVDLPPLPEALASTDLDRIKPAPNQPSPQTPIIAEPSADPALARTSYDVAPSAPNVPMVPVTETTIDGRMARLKKLQEALAQAGFDLDINVDGKDLNEISLAKSVCEKCDGDTLFCPSESKSTDPAETAGGMKLVADRPPTLGVTIRDSRGVPVLDSNLKIDEALKNPGKTETTMIPLGGHVALEIKATLVPATRVTARKLSTATTPK